MFYVEAECLRSFMVLALVSPAVRDGRALPL